jgi:hypothetical protein
LRIRSIVIQVDSFRRRLFEPIYTFRKRISQFMKLAEPAGQEDLEFMGSHELFLLRQLNVFRERAPVSLGYVERTNITPFDRFVKRRGKGKTKSGQGMPAPY